MNKNKNTLNAIFVTDSSSIIGLGHLSRCLSLAEKLRKRGVSCSFICRNLPGNGNFRIVSEGHQLFEINWQIPYRVDTYQSDCKSDQEHAYTDKDVKGIIEIVRKSVPELLIMDSYQILPLFETSLCDIADVTLLIDDLVDRPHYSDLLLNQNLGFQQKDYDKYVGSSTQCLLGPKFSLLNSAFEKSTPDLQRFSSKYSKNNKKRILVSMGGTDNHNYTRKVLEELKAQYSKWAFEATVLLSSMATHLDEIEKFVSLNKNWCSLSVDVTEMPSFLAEFDICVGAGGVSALERCSVGLPSIIIPVAENQIAGTLALDREGACILCNTFSELPVVFRKLFSMESQGDILNTVRSRGRKIVDGAGCGRVADILIDEFKNKHKSKTI